NRILSSIEQTSRHGIVSYLLPQHSICYPSSRSILLPILPVCTCADLSSDKERLGAKEIRSK
ncbi:hypothetical protein, partial [Candidatus Binatus sp.]|uniref:hypothetical protein n=1 Tax=Candidatus Binatus sp. TaxID=2811406 RepID=UPI003CC64093